METDRYNQLALAAELIDRATLAADGLARDKWLALANARVALADSLAGLRVTYREPNSGEVFTLSAGSEQQETRDATFYATRRPVTDSDGRVSWVETDC